MPISIRFLLGVIAIFIIVLFIFYPSVDDYYNLGEEEKQITDYPIMSLVMVLASLLMLLVFVTITVIDVWQA